MKTKPSGAKVCAIILPIFLFKIDEEILWLVLNVLLVEIW